MKNYLIAMSFCAAVLVPAMASSAPVTFGFEAVVNHADVVQNLQTGILPAPPIPIEIGDTLEGSFTFDPDVPATATGNPSTTVYMAELQVKVKDIIISSDSFSIEVFDDSLTVGTLGPPLVFEDFDGIRLGCSPSLPTICQSSVTEIPGVGSFHISTELDLHGDMSVLDTVEVPGAVDIWNDLDSFRSISLVFDPIESNLATVFFIATVGSLETVPEPSSLSLILLIASTIGSSSRTRLSR